MSLRKVIIEMKVEGSMPGGKCEYSRTIIDGDYSEAETIFQKDKTTGSFGPYVKCPVCGVMRVPQVERRSIERGRPDIGYDVMVFPTHTMPVRKSGVSVPVWYEQQAGQWIQVKAKG